MKKKKVETEKTIALLYLGERLYSFGGIQQVFKEPSGKLRYFSGIRGAIAGEHYPAVVEGDSVSMATRPKWLDVKQLKEVATMTEAERLEYEAHKEIVKHERQRKKKMRLAKKPHPDITKAIELLRPFCRSMDKITLSSFSDYIENQLSKKVKRK